MKEALQKLRSIVPQERFFCDEPMAGHTTFRVGGKADCFVIIHTERELTEALTLCRERELPAVVIGRGSNLLVSDAGFRGVVLCTAGGFSDIGLIAETETDGKTESEADVSVCAQSGATLSALANFAKEQGLSGVAFAAGIPGTVGGGVIMNAGAYGGELGDTVRFVRVVDRNGRLRTRSREEMAFSYRTSAVRGSGEIVLDAVFALQRGDRAEIARTMEELADRRREKQPLNYASAGSTWKRPEGTYAAKLIEEAGCKGLSVGDAQISEKHAGFLINRGSASAADIRALMRLVEERVFENSGVRLEPEVVMLGW